MSPITRPYSGQPTWEGAELETLTEEVVTTAARVALSAVDLGSDLDESTPVTDILAVLEAAGVLRQLGAYAEARALTAARALPQPLSWDQIARAAGYPARSTGQRRHTAAPETIRTEGRTG